MKCTVLFASPRPEGNTRRLLEPCLAELRKLGWETELFSLYGLDIRPCTACRACQKDWNSFGCCQDDDLHPVFASLLSADLILLATPIYSWYCTPPLKAAMDRLVYGMNKYYGAEKGPALWAGKALATLVTCGYPPEKGADLWEAGLKRYARHSRLRYLGMLAEHDPGYKDTFMDPDKALRAADFAWRLDGELRGITPAPAGHTDKE